MAIKVGGVSVINNSFGLENIEGADGTYNNWHPAETVLTSASTLNINLLLPHQKLVMASNVAFTAINKSFGRNSVLILDTSATPYTPSFDSLVEFPGGEPTWTDHRYWTISFMCWNSSNVRATALGFDAPGAASGLPSSFTEHPDFVPREQVFSNTSSVCWVSVSFEHEPSNNRIKVGWWNGNSTAASATDYTYVTYTGLTNITSVQYQYNVDSQSTTGKTTGYSSGPTPVGDGYNPATYYPTNGNGSFTRFWWYAIADSTFNTTTTSANLASGSDPDFRIKIVCDQGTLYSTCDVDLSDATGPGVLGIYCRAQYGTQKSV